MGACWVNVVQAFVVLDLLLPCMLSCCLLNYFCLGMGRPTLMSCHKRLSLDGFHSFCLLCLRVVLPHFSTVWLALSEELWDSVSIRLRCSTTSTLHDPIHASLTASTPAIWRWQYSIRYLQKLMSTARNHKDKCSSHCRRKVGYITDCQMCLGAGWTLDSSAWVEVPVMEPTNFEIET